MSTLLNVAREFSRSPAGRHRGDGPFSGERFREDFLIPAMEKGGVEVDFSGVLTLGSSFLEEAFAGLIRERGYSEMQIHQLVKVKSPVKMYEEKVWKYINDAQKMH